MHECNGPACDHGHDRRPDFGLDPVVAQCVKARALDIARELSENDFNNKHLRSWSTIGWECDMNVTGFFERERSKDPNSYAQVKRLLEKELTDIFAAAGWNPKFKPFTSFFGKKSITLGLYKPLHGTAEASEPACECTCGKCCHQPAKPKPPQRYVPQGVLRVSTVNERIHQRAKILAVEIAAKVSANDFSNASLRTAGDPRFYIPHEWEGTEGKHHLEFDLTDIMAAERKTEPLWLGSFYDLQAELKRILEPHGFAVRVERRDRNFKPDRYLLQLKKKNTCGCGTTD